MKKRYLIDYENAHWCGGQLNVVVYADSEDEARDIAEQHMIEAQLELFSSEYEEEPDAAEECPYVINSIEEFDENHDDWQFYQDPVQQANFYPEVGEP